jgi:hypothetical protein
VEVPAQRFVQDGVVSGGRAGGHRRNVAGNRFGSGCAMPQPGRLSRAPRIGYWIWMICPVEGTPLRLRMYST